MAIFEETVTGYTAVEVYGGLAACTQYLGTRYSAAATAFLALTADDQKRCLIAATDYFQEQLWSGTAVGTVGGTATALHWPASGVTDKYGNAVDSTTVPLDVVNGCFQMAAEIAAKSSIQNDADAGSNVKSIGGGGAQVIQFFAPTSARNGTASTMPQSVQRLVGPYLSSSTSVALGASSGVSNDGDSDRDDTSAFDPAYDYTVTRA